MNARQESQVKRWIAEEYAIGTPSAIIRAKLMEYYLQSNSDGAYGSACEVHDHTYKSRKERVSTQGKADTYIKFRTTSGRIDYIPVEVKTNGGRVESLYKAGAPRFVVYSMSVSNSLATYFTKQKIFPTTVFLDILENVNAIKNTNGKNPERAIQAVSKKLYTVVSDWSIEYNPDAVYTADDFDGLEW